MGTTRRQFLTMAGAFGLAASLPAWASGVTSLPAGHAPAERMKGAIHLADLHKETFDAHLGTAFAVKDAGGREVPLALSSVTGKDDPVLEHFSLIFSGPAESYLPQGTYEFAHPGVGRFSIFIVPIGGSPQGFRYQAVFNRLKN